MATYDVSAGDGQVAITNTSVPNKALYVSANISGDGSVDGAVTVQLQQSNDGTGWANLGAAWTVNTSTNEFKDIGAFNGKFLRANITVGLATAGTITITPNYK